MRKIALRLIIPCLFLCFNGIAQVSLVTPNGSYAENFDVMAGTTSYPVGWTAIRFAGTGAAFATLTPVVSTGTSNTGGAHNVGTATTDRALGTLASGSTVPALGASFVNNTGSIITGFTISAIHEQWRTGSNVLVESILFEYSLDATSLSTGTWTALPSLDLVEILTALNTNAAVDGNLSENRAAISGSASLLNIPAGATFWIRWKDADNTGSDGIYAVDDLQMTYTNASVINNTVSASPGTNASEPSTPGTFTLTLSTPAPVGGVTVNYTLGGTATETADYTDAQSGTITIPEGSSTGSVTISLIDDTDFEGTETVTINITAASSGYAIANASAAIDLLDNDTPPSISVVAGIAPAEPATTGTFTINLSTATTATTNVDFAFTGTAGYGTDYTVSYSTGTAIASASGTLTLPAGTSTVSITITPNNDADVEAPETIVLTLSNPGSPYIVNGGGATLNLASDDLPPFAPISLTGTYTQNFDELANAGTTNHLSLTGWMMNETGGSARDNDQYAFDNGGSNTGDTYSYGAASSSERALGSLQSGSLIPTFGSAYTNNTGMTINKLRVTYTGEQWRLGATGRNDRFDFQYSTDATTVTNGTWTDVDQLDFIAPNSTGSTGARVGNDAENRVLVSFDISGLSIAHGATFFIRWNDQNASGSDDGLAIDDLAVEANPLDLVPPAVLSLSPSNGASNVSLNSNASIVFNEPVQKNTGNIILRSSADNSAVATIDVSSTEVTINSATVSFSLPMLAANSGYYIEVDNGAFEDLSGNDFGGISGSSTWAFTTGTIFFNADFNTCTSALSDGFTQYSVNGVVEWACTAFGRDPAAPAGTAAFPSGVQINGFFGGTNIPNTDWLISPSFDLSGTTFPLLSFWSRTAFNGPALQLKVSTNYTGGDPTLATWTDLNGKFPAQTSNVWTLSSDINLTAFKSSNVHIAFVYFSSDDDGARWTLDDISVNDSPVPPPPSLTVGITDMQFAYVASGATADKSFTFIGNDLVEDVTLAATGDFLLSKDGSNFSASVSYSQAEANNVPQTVYVRFAPTQANQNFEGNIVVATSTLSSTITLKGTSIDPSTTLEIVNWNMEWFGSTDPTLGPTNDNLQEQNAKTIMQTIGADLYALVEVVDEARLASVVSQMPGYAYIISDYGSHTNVNGPDPSPLSEAQKEAFVYKTSVFSNITSTPLLSLGTNNPADLSNPAYNWWSSGRFPFLMTADVTLNCVTKNIKLIVVHAKANTSPTNTSYARRKSGADSLYTYLNVMFPDDNIIILGDFNDDLDQSITAGFTTTSWSAFTTDATRYDAITLPLSLAGKKSTVGYNDVIDHVIISNELTPYYMPQTANILTDVTSLVSNYGNTTSDHYPVFSRFKFDAPPAVEIVCPENIVTTSAPGVCGATAVFDILYLNGCGETTLTQTAGLPSGATFPVGVTTNTFVVSDAAGATSTCSFTVTVTDNEPPTITCPGPVTKASDAGTCGAIVDYVVNFGDNCTGASIQQTGGLPAGSVFPAGVTTNSFIVTDASGNTATCSFTVTVTDQQAPTFTRPADKTIAFNGNCSYDASPVITGDVTNESDNCSAELNAVYTDVVSSCGNTVTIQRLWSLTDNNGNAAPAQVQTITVTDNNTAYIIYAAKEATFGEFNYLGGSVGVTSLTGKAQFKLGSIMPSAFAARAKTVTVHPLAYVPNRINSPAVGGPNPVFQPFAGNTSGLPTRTISASTTVPVSGNYKDLKIKKNVSVTITGNLYGKIDIEKGAQVTFASASGIVNIESLKVTGDNGSTTLIKFASCTSVRVKDKVDIGEFTIVNAGGPMVTFYLGDANNDEEQFTISGNANSVTANVYLPKGELRVKGDLNLLNGWFIAEKVNSDGRLVVWNDNNCETPDQDVESMVRASTAQGTDVTPELATRLSAIASPNPTDDHFMIKTITSAGGPISIRVTDATGRTVERRSPVTPNTTVRIGAEWPAGLYFAEVTQGAERVVLRVVKGR